MRDSRIYESVRSYRSDAESLELGVNYDRSLYGISENVSVS